MFILVWDQQVEVHQETQYLLLTMIWMLEIVAESIIKT